MTSKTCENSHFWQKGSTFMARPSLAEKDILNPSEAIEYFVLWKGIILANNILIFYNINIYL